MGKAGRRVASDIIPQLKDKREIDFAIANGENVAGGFGITENLAHKLYSYGIDCLTSGNHLWDRKEIISYLDSDPRLLRPANYPPGTPGFGSGIYETDRGMKIGVLCLMGRVFMKEIDCPFRVGEIEVEKLRERVKAIVVDMHGEATSEKVAMGRFLDGKVSAVVGTHTHVQTADETILPGGAAYVTDVGMTGAFDSVIGLKTEVAIQRFLTQIPHRLEAAKGDLRMNAVVLEIDEETGKAKSIERLELKMEGEVGEVESSDHSGHALENEGAIE